jgi:serine/threonine protein kinase
MDWLGEGSNATAYRVTRKYDGLQCVAKVLKYSINGIDPEGKAIYEKELQVLKKADHPFHIEFIENFVYQKYYFCIIAKYAADGDFLKLIYEEKKDRGFTEKEALIYLAQMLLAVESLHTNDICHRDLKPNNIFVAEKKGEFHILKIGDFGCARQDLFNAIKNKQMTVKVGSPAYWAPEIFDEE